MPRPPAPQPVARRPVVPGSVRRPVGGPRPASRQGPSPRRRRAEHQTQNAISKVVQRVFNWCSEGVQRVSRE
eukprot:7263206-Lingulodinium_polyedra.AAC.1